MNNVQLIGNLTRDPELRYTPAGTAVADLRIAVNTVYYSKGTDGGPGEKREDVLFIGIVVWGKQAENAGEYLSKGSKIGVTGRLASRDWETKDGQKRTTIELVADKIDYLTPKSDRGTAPRDTATQAERPASAPKAGGKAAPAEIHQGDDDEVPF